MHRKDSKRVSRAPLHIKALPVFCTCVSRSQLKLLSIIYLKVPRRLTQGSANYVQVYQNRLLPYTDETLCRDQRLCASTLCRDQQLCASLLTEWWGLKLHQRVRQTRLAVPLWRLHTS